MDDYPNCNAQDSSYIGNGYCDGGNYNTAACGFDGGDCEEFNAKYANCNAYYPSDIGDGFCTSGDYNTAACGFDGGDCDFFNKYPDCNVPYQWNIGDGYCHGGYYNTAECGFDGGDCNNYPNCNVDNPSLIGDGNCDGGDYNTTECDFDGGDCTSRGPKGFADTSDPGCSGSSCFTLPRVPVWLIVGGVVGGVLFLFIAIGIVICKMKRNASRKHLQEVVAGGAGVQTGNANYDRNNQQETFSVQPSAVPVYAFEAAPTTEPTAFCVNCGTATSKTAFCTGCGVPN